MKTPEDALASLYAMAAGAVLAIALGAIIVLPLYPITSSIALLCIAASLYAGYHSL